MKMNTLRFGEIEIDPKDVIRFPNGLPGFENLNGFIFIKPDEELPFSFLQSIEDGDIAFITTNPFIFYPDYDFEISEAVERELKIQNEADVMVWSIVTIHEEISRASINLLAPVIINIKECLGKQMILNGTDYRTKHKLILNAPESPVEKAASKEEDPC